MKNLIIDAATDKIFFKVINNNESYTSDYPNSSENFDRLVTLLFNFLKKNNLELCTENAVYSYGKYYYAFSEAFKKINIEKYDINNVLILGLGMGSIIEILEEYFEKLSFTGVEKDNAIIL